MVKLWCAFALGAVRPKGCVADRHHSDAPPISLRPPRNRTNPRRTGTTEDPPQGPIRPGPTPPSSRGPQRAPPGRRYRPAGCRQYPWAPPLPAAAPRRPRCERDARNRLCPARHRPAISAQATTDRSGRGRPRRRRSGETSVRRRRLRRPGHRCHPAPARLERSMPAVPPRPAHARVAPRPTGPRAGLRPCRHRSRVQGPLRAAAIVSLMRW